MYDRPAASCGINLGTSDVLIIILEQLNSNLTSRHASSMVVYWSKCEDNSLCLSSTENVKLSFFIIAAE
jgi:hypothetical protein